MTPEEEEALEVVWVSKPETEKLETVDATCACPGQIWPVPALMPYGRCGRCGTGVRLVP